VIVTTTVESSITGFTERIVEIRARGADWRSGRSLSGDKLAYLLRQNLSLEVLQR
jgi:hypothetical protein